MKKAMIMVGVFALVATTSAFGQENAQKLKSDVKLEKIDVKTEKVKTTTISKEAQQQKVENVQRRELDASMKKTAIKNQKPEVKGK